MYFELLYGCLSLFGGKGGIDYGIESMLGLKISMKAWVMEREQSKDQLVYCHRGGVAASLLNTIWYVILNTLTTQAFGSYSRNPPSPLCLPQILFSTDIPSLKILFTTDIALQFHHLDVLLFHSIFFSHHLLNPFTHTFFLLPYIRIINNNKSVSE